MLAQDDLCRSSPSPDRIIIVIIIARELSNLEIVYMHGIYPEGATSWCITAIAIHLHNVGAVPLCPPSIRLFVDS